MAGFVQVCLGFLSVFAPFDLVLLSGCVYGLGIGAFKLPGIGRHELQPGKEWTTVPDLARKVTETVAAILSLIGTIFGLLGFLLPWVSINAGAASGMIDLLGGYWYGEGRGV